MDFNIERRCTLIGHTNSSGRKGYYPTFRIDIDGDRIAAEFDRYDMAPEDVERLVTESEDAISYAINKVIARNMGQYVKSKTGVVVEASVDLGVWYHDDLFDVDETRFDCSVALDEFELCDLPDEYDGFEYGALDYGDDVWLRSVWLGLTDEWYGPVTFHIADEDAYDRYIAARVRNEYGHELRKGE